MSGGDCGSVVHALSLRKLELLRKRLRRFDTDYYGLSVWILSFSGEGPGGNAREVGHPTEAGEKQGSSVGKEGGAGKELGAMLRRSPATQLCLCEECAIDENLAVGKEVSAPTKIKLISPRLAW